MEQQLAGEYAELFGRMCVFKHQPPLLFAIPEIDEFVLGRLHINRAPVELIVPDLDSFCIPEEDLERIQWAVDAAYAWE